MRRGPTLPGERTRIEESTVSPELPIKNRAPKFPYCGCPGLLPGLLPVTQADLLLADYRGNGLGRLLPCICQLAPARSRVD